MDEDEIDTSEVTATLECHRYRAAANATWGQVRGGRGLGDVLAPRPQKENLTCPSPMTRSSRPVIGRRTS